MAKITTKELRLGSVIIGVIATLMILLPALVVGDTDTSYTGF